MSAEQKVWAGIARILNDQDCSGVLTTDVLPVDILSARRGVSKAAHQNQEEDEDKKFRKTSKTKDDASDRLDHDDDSTFGIQ